MHKTAQSLPSSKRVRNSIGKKRVQDRIWARWEDDLLVRSVCVYGNNFLSIFLSEPTLAKSLNPYSSRQSNILSTATLVSAHTSIFVSVSSILSNNLAMYIIMATNKYDLPQPNAPWTSTTFASACFAAISSYLIALVSLPSPSLSSDIASSIPMISKSSF